MKTPIILQILTIVAIALLLGTTGKWFKAKQWPSETTEKEHFEIESDKVKNVEPNKTYYGTVQVTTRIEASSWPEVIVTVERDTLTSEEGGYFGVPN